MRRATVQKSPTTVIADLAGEWLLLGLFRVTYRDPQKGALDLHCSDCEATQHGKKRARSDQKNSAGLATGE